MTVYRVRLTENAEYNLRHYFHRAAAHAPVTAAQWMQRFRESIKTLAKLPERCPTAPENVLLDEVTLRQMLFGKKPNVYRVLFTVVDDEVRVLHIRRAAMDLATLDEILGADVPDGRD